MVSIICALTLAILHACMISSSALLVLARASQDSDGNVRNDNMHPVIATLPRFRSDPIVRLPRMRDVSCPKQWCSPKTRFTMQKFLSTAIPSGQPCLIPYDFSYSQPCGGDTIAPISVARTGSETLVESIVIGVGDGPGAAHDHRCTMKDMTARHAKRIVLSCRQPEERIKSAYAHEARSGFGGLFAQFKAPSDASNHAHDFAINIFLDALQQIDHPRHVEAMASVWNQHNSLLPISEFYLQNASVPDWVDFQVLCTCDLKADIKALASKWNFEYVPVKITSPGRDSIADVYHPKISDRNLAWLRSLFARDYKLHEYYCAKCGRGVE